MKAVSDTKLLGERDALLRQLALSEKIRADMQRSWELKIIESESIRSENQKIIAAEVKSVNNSLPNLVNLNEDPQLSEILLYIIKDGTTTIGSAPDSDIHLTSVMVRNKHGILHFNATSQKLQITALEKSIIYVDGEQIKEGEPHWLNHGDRIIIGNKHFFRLNIPKVVAQQKRMSLLNPTEFSVDKQFKGYKFASDELERVQATRHEKVPFFFFFFFFKTYPFYQTPNYDVTKPSTMMSLNLLL